MFNNISRTGLFFLGAAAGIAVAALSRTETFKKVCAKVIGAGIEVKDQATNFVETIKEDAEDVAEEAKQQKQQQTGDEI